MNSFKTAIISIIIWELVEILQQARNFANANKNIKASTNDKEIINKIIDKRCAVNSTTKSVITIITGIIILIFLELTN